MPVSKDEFRRALRCFPSGVTVVTCRDAEGLPRGMTVSAFTSVSLEPPLVLVCIDRRASIHNLLVPGGHFAVNILAEGQADVSRRFATNEAERFHGVSHFPGVTSAPVLAETLAALDCLITDAYPGGDHTIVVGRVEATEVNPGAPLVYYDGGYARVQSQK